MMGEYLFYYKGVYFGGLYDDRFLLKITKYSATNLSDYPSDFPYEGGGEMIRITEDIDKGLLNDVIVNMCDELPKPKKKN